MRKPRLDKSRPYGEVHPAGTDGIHYEQDGFPFDHTGLLVVAALTQKQVEDLNRPPPKRAPDANAAGLTAEQIAILRKAGALTSDQEAAFGKAPPDDDGDEGGGGEEKKDGDETDAETETELNLEAWLRGERPTYHFPNVQAAVKQRQGKWITSKKALVSFLVTDKDGPELCGHSDLAKEFQDLIATPARPKPAAEPVKPKPPKPPAEGQGQGGQGAGDFEP